MRSDGDLSQRGRQKVRSSSRKWPFHKGDKSFNSNGSQKDRASLTCPSHQSGENSSSCLPKKLAYFSVDMTHFFYLIVSCLMFCMSPGVSRYILIIFFLFFFLGAFFIRKESFEVLPSKNPRLRKVWCFSIYQWNYSNVLEMNFSPGWKVENV